MIESPTVILTESAGVIDTVETRLALGFPSPRGWCESPAEFTPGELRISMHPVMQDWESSYMKQLAGIAASRGGTVLEVGYGLGLSSRAILSHPEVTGYEVIECHPDVAARAADDLRSAIGDGRARLHVGFWQDVTPLLRSGSLDGILFDTYPLTADEIHGNHFSFLGEAHRLLRPGGVLTYYSDEPTHLSPFHLTQLRAAGFFTVDAVVCDVNPPPDCEYWQAPTIVAPIVHKNLTGAR